MMRWAALLICLAGSAAHADSDLLVRGTRHYTYGEYAQAIQVLERAGRSIRDPKQLALVHLYLGLSHAVIGGTAEAERCFVTALTHNPRVEPDAVRIKPELVSLFARTRDRQRATLRVEADQPDAVAVVDGGAPAKLPLHLSLPVGAHKVQVRSADGRMRETRAVLLPPKAVVQISARLGREVSTRRTAPQERPARREPSPHPRLWTWIVGAGALASFAVAGGLWASVRTDMTEYDDPATPDEQALAMEDPIRRKVAATNVMVGLGGVLAVSAAVLFFLEGRRPSAVHATTSVDPRGFWAGAGWKF